MNASLQSTISRKVSRCVFCLLAGCTLQSVADPVTVGGYIRGGGSGILYAYMRLFNLQSNLAYSGQADDTGYYLILNVTPGTYYLKAEADGYADEWYDDVMNQESATPVTITTNAFTRLPDFDLQFGQAPAWVQVNSEPPGALVYIDYIATTNLTPATVNIGEAVSRKKQKRQDWYWHDHAAHVVTVRKKEYPRPPPQMVPGLEAETCLNYFSHSLCDDYFVASICDDFLVNGICSDYFISGICDDFFDLNATNMGSLYVTTDPPDARIFVDYTDYDAGFSPVQVDYLLQGWHTVFAQKDGCLLPRPVRIFIVQQITNTLHLTLSPVGEGTNRFASIKSVPPGAYIYPGYFPSTNQTDFVMDTFDAAAVNAERMYSISHPITLYKHGYLKPLAQYAVHTKPSPLFYYLFGDYTLYGDSDLDGLLDVWEAAYGISTNDPSGDSGWHGDPDHDGFCNYQEMIARTDPTDASSLVEFILFLKRMTRSAGPTLYWKSMPECDYIIYRSYDLMGPWERATGILRAMDYTMGHQFFGPERASNQYYRLHILP
jgi:hypothetical protein